MGRKRCAVEKDLACGDPGTPSRLTKPPSRQTSWARLNQHSDVLAVKAHCFALVLAWIPGIHMSIPGLRLSTSMNVSAGLSKLGVTEGRRTEAKVMKLRYARGRCFPYSCDPNE